MPSWGLLQEQIKLQQRVSPNVDLLADQENEAWPPPPPFHADTILNRLVNGAIKLELKGELMRKKLNFLTDTDHSS